MISAIWPAEFKAQQESVFRAIAAAAGGTGRRLWVVPVSFRSFPETTLRANEALRRAKRQPKSAFGRWLKRALLAGQYNWSRHYFAANPTVLAVAWNGLTGTRRAFLQGATDAGAARLHCELAPLPGFVTVDPMGVNAEGLALEAEVPAIKQDVSPLLKTLRDGLVSRPSRRSDVTQSGTLPADVPPFVFVPLQVPDDSQLRIFAGWVGDIPGFLEAVTRSLPHLPEGWQVRIKEHPSAKTSFATVIDRMPKERVVRDNTTDTFELVARAQAVLTINSSVGFQALLWDKPVLATGHGFWTRSDLVDVVEDELALDMAFAGLERAQVPTKRRHEFIHWLVHDYLVPVETLDGGAVRPDVEALKTKIENARTLA